MNKTKLIIGAALLLALAGLAFLKPFGDRGIVPPTVDAELTNSADEKIQFSKFRGKVVFVNNWASWCGPCIAEMPAIQALKKKVEGNAIEFVMVSFDRSKAKAEEFITKKGYDFNVYFPGQKYPYMTNSIPATFILDKSGKVVREHIGMADFESEEVLSELITLSQVSPQ
jgi:thiol-disulfide isomerase/thioredoxin